MKDRKEIKYKLFEDVPEFTLTEVDSEDYGDIMEIGTFLQACIGKCFMDYDGYGYFCKEVDGILYKIRGVCFSIDLDSVSIIDSRIIEAVGDDGDSVTSIFHFCNTLGIEKLVWYNK